MNQKKKSSYTIQKQAAGGRTKSCQRVACRNMNPRVVPRMTVIPRHAHRGI
ncbi:hypothetical protein [Lacrimispora saccharolytica]|nr:hypothetical protein [Lacrimispora saccharolytica]QRV18152.1 hypothetical protein I6K70_11275 [Lacrimispora saccharolytica]